MPAGRALMTAGATGEIVVERIHGERRDLQRDGPAAVARPEASPQGAGQGSVRHGARRRPVGYGVHFVRVTTVCGGLTGRFLPGFPGRPVSRPPHAPRPAVPTAGPDVVSPLVVVDWRRAKKRARRRGRRRRAGRSGAPMFMPRGFYGVRNARRAAHKAWRPAVNLSRRNSSGAVLRPRSPQGNPRGGVRRRVVRRRRAAHRRSARSRLIRRCGCGLAY